MLSGGGEACIVAATGFRVQPLMEGLGGVQHSVILPVHHQLNYVHTPQLYILSRTWGEEYKYWEEAED